VTRVLSFSALVVLLICVFSNHALGQQRTAQPQPLSVAVGVYSGSGKNSRSMSSEAILSLDKFDRRTKELEGTLEFPSWMCSQASFSGIADNNGITLSGPINCIDTDNTLIARCTFSGVGRLTCSYSIKEQGAVSAIDKGSFDISRDSARQSIRSTAHRTTRSTVIYETRTVPAPTPIPAPTPKKYKVTFPSGSHNVDLAMVNTDRVTLRSSPYSSDVTRSLAPGSLLTLIDRSPVNGMVKVIDYETGTLGWVSSNEIEIRHGSGTSREKLLERSPSSSNRNPTVYLKNDTDRTITFGFGSQSYLIGPYQSKELEIPPGQYKYYVASQKVMPLIGEEYFDAGYRYTWTFYIETRYR